MAKARTYYTLAIRRDGKWSPEFGDYDRDNVNDEWESYFHGDCVPRDDLRIVTSGDAQADVDAAIAALNEAAA